MFCFVFKWNNQIVYIQISFTYSYLKLIMIWGIRVRPTAKALKTVMNFSWWDVLNSSYLSESNLKYITLFYMLLSTSNWINIGDMSKMVKYLYECEVGYLSRLLEPCSESAITAASKGSVAELHARSTSTKLWLHFFTISSSPESLRRVTKHPEQQSFKSLIHTTLSELKFNTARSTILLF